MIKIKKDTFITGLDIGSSKVSAVMSQVDGSGVFEIISHATVPSKGVSRGSFFDLDESVDAVSKALSALKARTGIRPSSLYVNITGESVKASRSKGMIPLALYGREVTKKDIERCIDVASTVHLPFDREIIHKIVRNFAIDDQPWIKNPIG
ncbi:MAG TPA: cell division protein FtsA, partial [Candidatus Omnitrophota bacterium]|nr:cell division protein FtsA [Candidatus Omnitrophota bacterium]